MLLNADPMPPDVSIRGPSVPSAPLLRNSWILVLGDGLTWAILLAVLAAAVRGLGCSGRNGIQG